MLICGRAQLLAWVHPLEGYLYPVFIYYVYVDKVRSEHAHTMEMCNIAPVWAIYERVFVAPQYLLGNRHFGNQACTIFLLEGKNVHS